MTLQAPKLLRFYGDVTFMSKTIQHTSRTSLCSFRMSAHGVKSNSSVSSMDELNATIVRCTSPCRATPPQRKQDNEDNKISDCLGRHSGKYQPKRQKEATSMPLNLLIYWRQ
jgi:hypothetical protein